MAQLVTSQASLPFECEALAGELANDPSLGAVCNSSLQWVFARFDDLGVHALHDALALRCRVFILEQVAYQDPDEADKHSAHLLGYGQTRADGKNGGNRPNDGVTTVGGSTGAACRDAPLVACLRVVDPGARYAEPSIGRVVVAPEWRGRGIARELMQRGLARCGDLWPGRAVRISAQLHLKPFYASLAFETVGVPYLEDDIPHIEMLRPAPFKETS